jgi:hypothetical protein
MVVWQQQISDVFCIKTKSSCFVGLVGKTLNEMLKKENVE